MARWTAADIPRLDGRVALVTGANSGLGYATTKGLAAAGATVLMACRDEARCATAAERIRRSIPGATVRSVALNLADLDSVRACAEEVVHSVRRLDILVNNAGVMAPPHRMTTRQGFELQFGVNHLGHFALTGLLLPLLLRTPGARVVSVSSIAHEAGHVDFADLQLEHGYTPYGAYSMSKIANLLFMLELDRRLKRASADVVSVGAHPGFVSTNLQAAGPFLGEGGLSAWFVLGAVRLLGQSARRGAEPQLYAATARGVMGGEYFGPKQRIRGPVAPGEMSRHACDEMVATRLWDESRRLTDVDIDAALASASAS